MKKLGIFYSFEAKNTGKIVEIIEKKASKILGIKEIDKINVEEVDIEQMRLTDYEYAICGVPTWFDGELPVYWDELMPAIEDLDMNGKKVAIFGAGDQVGYPENFVDAIGLLGEAFEKKGATLVGFTSTEGYTYEKSAAQRGDQFMGLALDVENQNDQTKKRIENWLKQLKSEFGI